MTFLLRRLAIKFGDAGADAPRDQPAHGVHPTWVRELMQEEDVRALPRAPGTMGRALDSRDFWTTFRTEPRMGLD